MRHIEADKLRNYVGTISRIGELLGVLKEDNGGFYLHLGDVGNLGDPFQLGSETYRIHHGDRITLRRGEWMSSRGTTLKMLSYQIQLTR